MTEQKAAEGRRRGGGFPSLPLQDAVDAVVIAGQHGPDHSPDAFAAYLGHQTANSGAFRNKLASMRDWGLIARGDKDRVTLSALGQELVLAAPDHYQATEKLFEAFENCRVFGMLYNDSAKTVALELARLRTQVLMRYGVASNQADKFIDSFVKSAVFAGIARSDGSSVTLVPREQVVTGSTPDDDDLPDNEAVSRDSSSEPVLVTARVRAEEPARAVVPQVPVALRQQWPIDGGEIEFTIRTAEALPPSVYILVAEMAGVAERMKENLSAPEASPRAEQATPTFEITTNEPPAAYRVHTSDG